MSRIVESFICALAAITVLPVLFWSCAPADQGKLIFEDDFSDPRSGWEVSAVSKKYSVGYEKGEYLMTCMKKLTQLPAQVPNVGKLVNYVVEVDVRCVNPKIDDSTGGIAFSRQDNDNYYLLCIRPKEGSYSVGKNVAGTYSTIVDFTVSPGIKKDNDINRLKLKVQGGAITVYANGAELKSVNETSLPSGQIWLAMESADFIPRSYAFDNFKLYDLSSGADADASQWDIAANKKAVLFNENDFSKCDGAWINAHGRGKVDCANGVLNISDPNDITIAKTKDEWQLSDFAVEVDIAQINGDESSYAYLMFRAAATVFYWYGISNDSFDLFTSTDPVVMLQPWKKSTFVKPDRDTNRLKVICAGKTIELYVNGHKVGTYNDDSSLSGQLLLGVSAGSSKSGASYSFDNLKIYKLQ